MKNYLSTGDNLPMTAPAGGVVSGELALIGSIPVVPVTDAAEGQLFAGMRIGEFGLPAPLDDGVTPAAGDKCYLITADKKLTTTPSGNKLIGAFTSPTAVVLTGELV